MGVLVIILGPLSFGNSHMICFGPVQLGEGGPHRNLHTAVASIIANIMVPDSDYSYNIIYLKHT